MTTDVTTTPASRRRFLSFIPLATVAVSVPAVAAVQPTDPWDAFITAMGIVHPDLPTAAAQAKADGFAPGECYCIAILNAPGLCFSRGNGPTQLTKTYQGERSQ